MNSVHIRCQWILYLWQYLTAIYNKIDKRKDIPLSQSTAPGTDTTRTIPRLNVSNQRSVPWLLKAAAERRPEHPFIIWAPFDQASVTITYGDFYASVKSLAAGLAQRGISQGDFVLLHMENCPEFLQTWHACSQLGAVVVTTNTRSSSDEMLYFIEHCGARVAITQPAFVDPLSSQEMGLEWVACLDHDAGVSADITTSESGCEIIPFETLLVDASGFEPVDADPLAYNSVQYTSGTTSRPKGVLWTHANAIFAARSNANVCTVTADDIGHVFLPLYHTNALSYSHLSTLWAGATLVLQPRFSASRYWDCVIQHRCSWGIQIPFSLKALMGQPIPETHHFTRWGLGAHDPDLVGSV